MAVMFYEAFMFAAKLASIGVMSYDHAPSVAIQATEVVIESVEPPLVSKEKDALLMVGWIAHESAGRPHVDGDAGASLGAMQIGKIWLPLCGITEETLRGDRKANIACGYRVMQHLRDRCGGVKCALRAYASGRFEGTVRARQLVDHRCKESGAC
jgi:hypothetical protein